ncbi:MAG: hypothetical protein ABIS38_05185 [Sphingomicrobium sp.]
MASRSYQYRAAAYERAPVRRRVSGLALALGVNLLLLLVLLGIGAFRPTPQKSGGALVVDLLPDADDRPAAAKRATEVKQREVTRPLPPRPEKRLVIKSPIPPKVPVPLQMLELSKEDYAAADISKMPKSAPASGGSGGASGAGDSKAVGRGPRGETLYGVEWARHPTDAELRGYLPANAPDGYGLIACRTAPGNRVEDCVEIEQQPRGSHLASAVRQAAWQFRVRPPRKNGQPMIGEWVSIRIDYTVEGRE